MNVSLLSRWLRAGLAMIGCMAAMLAGWVATGVSHGPRTAVVVFMVLTPLSGAIAVGLFGMGSRKEMAANRKLAEQAHVKTRASEAELQRHPRQK